MKPEEKEIIEKLKNSVKKDFLVQVRKKYPHIYFAYIIKKLMDNDYNAEIIIDGPKGVGKSYLGFKIMEAFYHMIDRENLIFDSFIAPAPIDLIDEKLETTFVKRQIEEAVSKKVNLIVLDEAADILFYRDFFLSETKQFVKMLRKIRKYKISFIFIHPVFFELDPGVKYRSFTYWIHGVRRITNKYSEFVVLRGIDPKKEMNFDLKHLEYALWFYGIDGWYKNRYFLFSFKLGYDSEDYEKYKKMLDEKQKKVYEFVYTEKMPSEFFEKIKESVYNELLTFIRERKIRNKVYQKYILYDSITKKLIANKLNIKPSLVEKAVLKLIEESKIKRGEKPSILLID